MAVTTANKFWLGISKQAILNGDVGFGCAENIPVSNDISMGIPYYVGFGFAHPVIPKFNQLYLMVGMQSNQKGLVDPSTSIITRYDALRKGINTEYVNFYYDSDKYNMNVITSSMNQIQYSNSMLTTSGLFANKKLYKILDVYITDIKGDEATGYTFNLKIRYLEYKK